MWLRGRLFRQHEDELAEEAASEDSEYEIGVVRELNTEENVLGFSREEISWAIENGAESEEQIIDMINQDKERDNIIRLAER